MRPSRGSSPRPNRILGVGAVLARDLAAAWSHRNTPTFSRRSNAATRTRSLGSASPATAMTLLSLFAPVKLRSVGDGRPDLLFFEKECDRR